jgi:hypothetical protein
MVGNGREEEEEPSDERGKLDERARFIGWFVVGLDLG